MNKEQTKQPRVSVLQISPAIESDKTLHTIPFKATAESVGFDVMPREIIHKSENDVIVKIGWRMKPPKGFKIVLVPRSSLTKTNWIIQNSPGQGDPDFRGEYSFRFKALPTGVSLRRIITNLFRNKANQKSPFTYDPFPFNYDIACGQIFLEKVFNTEFHCVPFKDLGTTERGEGGYGSTNKNNNPVNN